VVEHVRESDSVWLSSQWRYSSTELECTECSKEWRLEGREFVKIGSDRALKQAREERLKLAGELQLIANDVADSYFSVVRTYASIKAQWEELRRLGLFNDSLGVFRQRVRSGRPIREMVFPRWDTVCMEENCTPEQRARADAILRRIKELTAAEEEAGKLIVRVHFTPSPEP
jgi:hypothetical protein